MWMKQQSRHENLTYVALWGMLFLAPLMSLYIRTTADTSQSFDWNEVLMVWRQYVVFLLLFLIHNFLLAPLLVYRQKRLFYFFTVILVAGLFLLYQCSSRPAEFMHHGPHPMAERNCQPPMHEQFDHEPPPFDEWDEEPTAPDARQPRFEPRHPAPFVGEHDIVSMVILILMFGMNIAVKLYFKSRGDQRKLVELEKENLAQQLEYLKYQINPHFFMNTLNNIHALVDIDPEKAKDTILELSKMMRFILYEGDKQGVPLSREFDFIRNYVTLMRLRYTDKVKISVDLPREVPDRQIPPLMLITFIENAFKHGISYQHESFIDIKVEIEKKTEDGEQKEERLLFHCRNSKADKPNQEKGGVGLANVKQRLSLLYDNNFTLNIQDTTDTYDVALNIPL